MTIHAYTSFSFSYLNRATVLAETLNRQHPDWVLWAVITDKAPEGFVFDGAQFGFDRVLYAEDMYGADTDKWLFKHDVVEACTAVKGDALLHIMAQPDVDKVLYFDPDIAVFNSMAPVADLLETHSIVLTPHQIDPEDRDKKRAIMDNEITSLGFGVFNLGFAAVKNDSEGQRFAAWWADRLRDWCFDQRDIGIFVDQKWCDLVPCLFDNFKSLRDPGYNVASWNLSKRQISFSKEGTALVNGVPLRFYHFTKLGPIGDMMTQRYGADNVEVYELWRWYRNKVIAATLPDIPQGWWHYAKFDNGVDIPKDVRVLYRSREDLRNAFDAPYEVENGLYSWLSVNSYV